MQVLKFGGSSVASAENILRVIAILQNDPSAEERIVVVSALGGVTDLLLEAATLAAAGNQAFRDKLTLFENRHLDAVRALLPVTRQSALLSLVKKSCHELEDIGEGLFLLRELTARSSDRMVAYGEWLSSQIVAEAMTETGLTASWVDARELIVTDSQYTKAEVDFTATGLRVNQFFSHQFASKPGSIVVVPGFIAANKQGTTTTLGRGGSDYTAAILAACLDASALQIWTDVSGMMTADPRLAPHARKIDRISYQEAMELSHFGAKVIYPPTLQPVMQKNMPVWIRNTFSPEDPGTLIHHQAAVQEQSGRDSLIRGITSMSHIALLSLEGSGMIGIPGFSKRLFEALSSEKINVILITQSSSEHSICVAVEEKQAETARRALDVIFANEIALGKVEPLQVEYNQSIVALVGEQMKSHPGISGRMFSAMGRNGVNIRAIAQGSSEKNISSVIQAKDVRKAINVLHEEFFEASYKQVNLFIVGTGNVGAKLISQLGQQAKLLLDQWRIQVKIVGLSNSRHQLIQEEGIDANNWPSALEKASIADLDAFVQGMIDCNLRNSIFVDVTANEFVASKYENILRRSISVVACNKIAASSEFANYDRLKNTAREFNAAFLFETNVGAGLPVIGTLNDLLRSGDRVNRIEAVLSGTLNFVFNHYDGSRLFADVVRQAQQEGYTEPDPRLDLSGLDVMRKIMILARECGDQLEMTEITNHSFLPASCMQGSVEDFYLAMKEEEPHFRQLLQQAQDKNCKLKFVASYDRGKASVGLQPIAAGHDFYHLYGKDNIVLFYTDRYSEQPLLVKGAGAGAAVTASGVFADILRAAH